ncbi:hypothetical protein [Pseudobdellovibrio exovorus]|uniref:AsmA domain-containing protein n=1 Tax=Pseudobdellovibrio exovorus JSS TaxID=1184267 RepID=M4VR26_9BACT|nr:hypothetical protein [Pseudobdellovibrio exovorus]AGH95624.1 hypothetical protein A11Q_1408 [Pseudobdellovibrio exovorus JSS]
MSRAVIDQPGLRILIVGLALSVFLGLAVRSQIAESRVQGYLNKSVDRLQREFTVDYETARVNLSSWGLPLPALIITNIRLSPKAHACQSSQIFVDELEVPISFITILGLSNKVPKIRAKSVELRITDIESCLGGAAKKRTVRQDSLVAPTPVSADVAAEGAVSPVVANDNEVSGVFTKKTRAELKEVYVEKLKFITDKKPDQPVLLRQVNLEFDYANNLLKEVNLTSKINAIKDQRSDLYFLNANVVASFKNTPTKQIESFINLKGKLLDGDTNVFLYSLSESHKISYEWSVSRVSLKALTPFFDSVDDVNVAINVDRSPTSVSFTNSGEIFLDKGGSAESKFRDFNLSVENGSLSIKELSLAYEKSRLKLKPFVLQMQSIPLAKVKDFARIKDKMSSFASLGQISGELNYSNERSFKFNGHINNVQAVFSNRGRRDLQNIDQAQLWMSSDERELKVRAQDFVINGQNVVGRLDVAHFYEKPRTIAQFKIVGNLFSSKIWEQFTYVEQAPVIDILWDYKKEQDEVHDIKVKVDSVSLPGIQLSQIQVDMDQTFSEVPERNKLTLSLKPARVIVNQSFLDQPVVAQIFNPAHGINLRALTSTKTQLNFFGADWKNIDFVLDSTFLGDLNLKSETRLTLKGRAEAEKGLLAKLQLQDKKQTYKFELIALPEGDVQVRSQK